METSKKLVEQAGIVPNLQLAIQKPGGGVTITGPHTVKLVDEKLITTTNYETGKQVPTMRYFFEENGEKRQYDVEVKDKNDNLDYKIQKLAQFEKGTMLIMECLKKGPRNYISIVPVDENKGMTQTPNHDDIPIIEEDAGTDKSFEDRLNQA